MGEDHVAGRTLMYLGGWSNCVKCREIFQYTLQVYILACIYSYVHANTHVVGAEVRHTQKSLGFRFRVWLGYLALLSISAQSVVA